MSYEVTLAISITNFLPVQPARKKVKRSGLQLLFQQLQIPVGELLEVIFCKIIHTSGYQTVPGKDAAIALWKAR